MDEITGTVERVTFHQPESGFTVLRVRPGNAGIITVVGRFIAPAEGEGIVARGVWKEDPTYGRQFAAEQIEARQAKGRAQIETFLGSGIIRGVGPSTAQQLYTAFGEKVFEILDSAPERLREISGIGKKRAAMIASSWAEQKSTRELMVFLADSGIGTARAGRIHKEYGPQAIAIIRENPYRLSEDIRGIGFATADGLALKLGIPRDSLFRLRAGVSHALSEASAKGHCGLPEEELLEFAAELLEVEESKLTAAIDLEVAAGRLRRDSLRGTKGIFLPNLHFFEKAIAESLQRIVRRKTPWPSIDIVKALEWVESRSGIHLAPSQRDAVALVMKSPVCIITGGPGVGKTTIVRSILRILEAKKVDVALAAPTGRAAKRLAESAGREAKTIHRLLEIDPKSGMFQRDESHPVECDFLIVDEASMVDVPLMHALLRGLPSHAALLLVGDVDQLPPVGPGEVLSDLIASNAIPVVRLTEVHRQSAGSRIILNAHAINEGKMPELQVREIESSDFFFFSASSASAAADRVIDLAASRIPAKFGFDPLREIQVLAPMRRTAAGIEALNLALQARLNPRASSGAEFVERLGTKFFKGDRVMQIVNDYEADIFNGDVGVIAAVDPEEALVTIDFDGRLIDREKEQLEDIVLAYATTIHKSQGSEYPAVIVVVSMAHALMLQRNLLYTAVTRARKLVVLVGEERAIQQAVRTKGSQRRWTKLGEWMGVGRGLGAWG